MLLTVFYAVRLFALRAFWAKHGHRKFICGVFSAQRVRLCAAFERRHGIFANFRLFRNLA